MSATKPIKEVQQIAEVKAYFLHSGHIRDYALFTVGINTALRISDILNLKWGDIYDFTSGTFFRHVCVREQKTGKQNCIPLNENAIEALSRLLAETKASGELYIFKSRKGINRPISRSRAYSIFSTVSFALSDVEKFSCHSLRKTFGYHAWKSGTSSVMLMTIYNHSSFSITKRYLGIDQQEKDLVYDSVLL